MQKTKLAPKFWIALVIFSLVGQIAWVVENMYFNVFIYKMFRASAADISLMVAASAVIATLTTIFIGALSDKLGNRKFFICGGYIIWGITIISFAFIRVGGRYGVSGKIYDDDRFVENIKGAVKAGIKVGVYFFTQAVNEKEAVQEADYTLKKIKKYQIDLPIVYDTEFMYGGRHNTLDSITRTKVTRAFCERVKQAGYAPMIYASSSYLRDELDLTKLPYDVWVAEWGDTLSYVGSYRFWQYTETGQVDGIAGNVDMDYMFGEYKL